MTLSTQQQILIEQRVSNEAKSTGAAYVLWFFLGILGAHRFYLGRAGSGAAMLILGIIALLFFPLLIISLIWALVDAFLIPGMIAAHKNSVRNTLIQTALLSPPST